MSAADLRNSLRRQHQAVAGDGVELFRQHSAAREQLWHIAEDAPDFDRALCGVFDPTDRSEIALNPFAYHRLGHRPHVKLGIKRASDAFDHDHSLLQEQKLGSGAHVEQPSDLEQQREQLRHRDLFRGAVVDRFANRTDCLGKAFDRMLPRHVPGLEVHLGGALVVAGDEAEQNFGEEAPLLRPEPAHDAEVDRDQFAGVVDEQIAGMHVGMEEAVAQGMPQKALDHRAGEAPEIESLCFECGAIGERRRFDPFEREHVASGAVPVNRGHAEIRVVPGVLRHLRERGRLEAQIHLDSHRTAQRLHHLDEPQSPRFRRNLFGIARREREGVEIDLEPSFDARPQHLYRHRAGAAAGRDCGAVHLRDGSSCHRPAETGE